MRTSAEIVQHTKGLDRGGSDWMGIERHDLVAEAYENLQTT